MNWLFSLYVAILFFILTPAVLLRIPKKGSKYTVAGVHAIVFAILLHFTGKFVWNVSMSMEGFREGVAAPDRSSVKTNEIKAGSAAEDPKKLAALQKKNEDDCAKKQGQGFKWNAETKTCNSDPNSKAPPKDEKKLAALQAKSKESAPAPQKAPAPAPAKKK